MTKHNAKWFLAILILGVYPLVLQATDIHGAMKVLADSALKDTTQIENAYSNLTSHYYQLGDIDSLQKYTYEYMDWCVKNNRPESRYTTWRQYIQRMTEKGMQDEAMSETAKLHDDAKHAKNKYGLACGEMCIGYNHRVFGNNVQLCLDSYNNALKLFEEGGYYRDAYVVSLNIIQTYLSRSEYVEAESYLNKLVQLEERMNRKKIEIDSSLHLRFLEFRVISLLANKGKVVAAPFIKEADHYYRQNSGSSTPEAWYGYKIMCCRILGDLKANIAYVDSLMNYQKTLGVCYPYNYFMKAQLQEQMEDYRAACRSYSTYVTVNDSVRTAEMDDKLSKYTAQFEVDRLKMEKLELSAKLNRERLVIALVAGGLILMFLLLITYLYIRTLSMNRKLQVARKAVHKMSQVKNSFIQHITHEIRTPLNSIVGFSTLLSEGGLDDTERSDYVAQVESNNNYLLGLMENILIIADMDSLAVDKPREVVNIDACLNQCANEFRPILKPGVELECLPVSGHSTIYTVHSWLKIVLTALLDNAVKFTVKGQIRISCKEDESGCILRIMVEDTGIGLKPENAEHLFERFYKVDLFTKGSGLGLAIAREITEMVGGRVYWDSTYQNGCRFVVEWPMTDRP